MLIVKNLLLSFFILEESFQRRQFVGYCFLEINLPGIFSVVICDKKRKRKLTTGLNEENLKKRPQENIPQSTICESLGGMAKMRCGKIGEIIYQYLIRCFGG